MEPENASNHSEILSPVRLSGPMSGLAVPDALYGMLGALLMRSSQMGDDIAEEFRFIGFPFPEAPYYLCYFSLEDSSLSQVHGRLLHGQRLAIYDELRDHFCDLMPDVSCISVLIMGSLFVVCFTSDHDLLQSATASAATHTQEAFGAKLHITASPLLQGIDQLETGFRMTQDLEQSRRFYTDLIPPVYLIPEDTTARISDREQMTQFEQSFFTAADQICGCVTAGDLDSAGDILSGQLCRIAENCIGFPYPTSLNLTINRFISLLHYRLAEQNLADWRYLSQQDFSRDLISCPTLAEIPVTCKRIAKLLIEHHRKRTEDRHDSLMHDIHAYIEANATDINMGLSAVAKEFHLKPREATEAFREYFGESINDVMHRARVHRARELLLTTDQPVQDIAEQVGYCSLATMYRAFTRFEGVAPGKLRQTIDADSHE